MPEVQFKGKEFVYNHHLTVPFRPLEMHPERSLGEVALDNHLVIHGDNLHALKSLLPHYAGKVDCIFIDPPYNTGSEEWVYNDNVNSPLINEWLNDNPVNKEDMLRHDKWLCLLWPRLRLLHELLSESGVIFICIDDNELHHLRGIMNEIFGEHNWIGNIVWKNATDNNPTRIAIEHEYIICFAKNRENVSKVWKSKVSAIKEKLIEVGNQFIENYDDPEELQREYTKWYRANKHQLWPLDRYKYIDKNGIYTGSQSVHNPGREGYRYDVIHPVTGRPCVQPLMGYRFPYETMQQLIEEDRILFGNDENKIVEIKLYVHDYQEKLSSVIELDGRVGAYELRDIFPGEGKVFDHPKPAQLVEQIISFAAPPGSIILDSFAGSGTTGHAALMLNDVDDGGRRFILVECEEYAETVTRERIRRVMQGVKNSSNNKLQEGYGGEFTYCTLGSAVELDKILTGEALPTFDALGGILFHMATNRALDPAEIDPDKWYLGKTGDIVVWMIYRQDIEWLKSPDAALTLQRAQAFAEADPESRHLVFAPSRFVSQRLLTEHGLNVEFVPLPYSLYRIQRDDT